MAKSKCPSCETIYELGERFCGVCGAPLEAPPEPLADLDTPRQVESVQVSRLEHGAGEPAVDRPRAVVDETQAPNRSRPVELAGPRSRTWLWIMLVGVVVGVVAVGGWWFTQRTAPVDVADGESVTPATADAEADARAADLAAQEKAAEERLTALVEELAAADRELAERQAAQEESARRLREQEARQEKQARLAADRAAAQKREHELAERERRLAEREAELAAAQQAAVVVPDDSYPEPVMALPQPEPSYAEATLRPGTLLEIEITETLSSRTSRVGDTFSSRLASDIYTDEGILAVPAGSEIRGKVIEVTPLKRVGGQASLGIAFTELIPPIGPPIGLKASFVELGKDRRKDKKKIIGAAIAGALLGRIVGGKGVGEVLAGAAVGAAAGTAAVAANAKGKDAEIRAGAMVGLVLEEVVTVTMEMTGVVER